MRVQRDETVMNLCDRRAQQAETVMNLCHRRALRAETVVNIYDRRAQRAETMVKICDLWCLFANNKDESSNTFERLLECLRSASSIVEHLRAPSNIFEYHSSTALPSIGFEGLRAVQAASNAFAGPRGASTSIERHRTASIEELYQLRRASNSFERRSKKAFERCLRSASRLRVERSFGRITSKGLREGLRKGLREELREALQDELERRGSRSSDELRAASNSFEQLRTASSFLEERRRRFEEPRTVPKSCEHLRRALNSLERLGRASRSVEEEPREDQRRGGPLYAPWDSVASESRPAVPPRTALEVFVHELHCIQATVAVVADDVMVCFVAVPISWWYFVGRRTPDGLGSRRFLKSFKHTEELRTKGFELRAASVNLRTAWSSFGQLPNSLERLRSASSGYK